MKKNYKVQKRFALNNPVFVKARKAVTNAIAKGDLPPAKELKCVNRSDGTCSGIIEWSHSIYDPKDLLAGIQPRCKSHHTRFDKARPKTKLR